MIKSDEDIKDIAILMLIFGGLAVLGWQSYEYLRFGVWSSVSIITALQWMNISWAINPVDWTGLHNILQFLPLSLSMVLAGLFITINNPS